MDAPKRRNSKLLFQQPVRDPNGSGYLVNDVVEYQDGLDVYEYTYTGDLFTQYETLIIGIEARSYVEGHMTNRSRIEYEHITPVPEPTTMLLFGTGLIGLAGFRRRKNQ